SSPRNGFPVSSRHFRKTCDRRAANFRARIARCLLNVGDCFDDLVLPEESRCETSHLRRGVAQMLTHDYCSLGLQYRNSNQRFQRCGVTPVKILVAAESASHVAFPPRQAVSKPRKIVAPKKLIQPALVPREKTVIVHEVRVTTTVEVDVEHSSP